MHLKRIQLVGFKSFVDTTTIPVLSHMNAVVGPNGCGKSNIVDAIRWVVGESSAKQLRGQSMSDVIFNGATGRKPVGKAAVELTFDNTDSRIVGEYAKFSEISVRREVVRDGQSSYYINGVSARRRDLLDLFLGTGLGPRSYSIIEQGMISQLIEKKPEDLRSHFEEVAGISKYRERRRETENRIRHTHDNLDRLNDLREELAKQLRHLKRQSNAAERYKALKQEERLVQAQIKALQWQALENRLLEKKDSLQIQTTTYESKVARQRELETEIEKARLLSTEWADEKEEVQRQFYQMAGEISRLEQEIKHKQEQIKQWESEREESAELWQELTDQSNLQSRQIDQLKHESEALAPQIDILSDELEQSQRALLEAEQQMQHTQSDWDDFQDKTSQTGKDAEVAKTNIRHYSSQLAQLEERQSTLASQLSGLSIDSLASEVSPLSERVSDLKVTVDEAQTQLQEFSHTIRHQREIYQETQANASRQRGELQKVEAQLSSLTAMQEAALEDKGAAIKPWLAEHGFENAPRFGKEISVHPGWELAIETIMGQCFDAICVDDLSDIAPYLEALNKGQLTAFDRKVLAEKRLAHRSIIDVIDTIAHAPSWLSTVYIAEDLTEALALKTSLEHQESVITQSGIWIGPNWIRMNKSMEAKDSFLMQEKRLKDLESLIQEKKSVLLELEEVLFEAKEQLESLESTRDLQQQTYQQSTAMLTESQAALSAKQSRLDGLMQQKTRIEHELNTLAPQQEQYASALQAAQETINTFESVQEAEDQERELLLSKRQESQEKLIEKRATTQQKKQQADEIKIRLNSNEKQLAVLTQTIASNQKQLAQLTERRDMRQAQLIDAAEPLEALAAELQNTLQLQVEIGAKKKTVELQWQQHQSHLASCSSERDEVIKQLTILQEEQQQFKLAQQEFLVRQSTLKEQITEVNFELSALLEEMPAEATLPTWEGKASHLQNKIDRLGPINLAAIDEHKTIDERKTYLDQQYTDLEEALEVLQNAIRKIDRETKHLFKDTYDKVNDLFQKNFPRIFGGGQASLHLTDDDLLTTGIIVKAQPPGKRNATIHMLSGGEKTLTAIALMFAMFQLNPAPFCVLDEVDAPLDDLNVGRFCKLVKEMSKDTQFLIISHNKVTIETADHLMGVTMHEPGVSRIVSVDMQAAVELVEA